MNENIKVPYISKLNTSLSSKYSLSPTTQSQVERTYINNTASTVRKQQSGIFDLARVFLSYESMSNKKLQKLCYYAQAWHLALKDEPIIEGCEFEAWVHGPVCKELYQYYREYGFENIPRYTDSIADINEEIREFATDVFDVYGIFTGNELEKMTHREFPWVNARGDLDPWVACDNIISETDMKEYYRSI